MLSLRSLIPSCLLLLEALPASAQNSSWPWQTYKSSSAEPPSLNITKKGETSPGYLFFDQNGPDGHQYSLFIMSDDNELVWQSASADYSAYKAQTLDGKPVLTFFNGISMPEPYGWGHGIIQVLDDSYESIYNVSLTAPQEGFVTIPELNATELYSYIDMHEARITPENTMLVTVYNVTQHDLSSVGGPTDGWVADSLFYEVDVKTNEIIFRWSALDHVDQIPIANMLEFYPLEEYGRNQSLPYGYFHINSVEKFDDGSYLISSRYYCSLFKIALDGSVVWTFQGQSGGDFELGPDLSFRYQHDARILEETESTLQISLFDNDNAAVAYGEKQTEGIILTLDTAAMTASLDQSFLDASDPVYSASQGSTQVLDDGHVVMGYGSTSKIREYAVDGTPVMTAQFGHGDGSTYSYRAYRLPWVGRPQTAPDVLACFNTARNTTDVYMSWNGATEHKSWKVFTGATESALTLSAHVARTGFETSARVLGQASYVRVEAQGSNVTAGVSSVVEAQSGC
ncbi:ASST-domain-containing protein [Xylariaceae sp. FL0016]|nr:ASST-domain-containing protein [Xylariaceae sp. FL0016]